MHSFHVFIFLDRRRALSIKPLQKYAFANDKYSVSEFIFAHISVVVSEVRTALPYHNFLSLIDIELCIVNSESGEYPNNLMRRAGLFRL